MAAVTPPQPTEAGDAAIIQVIPTTSPQDQATTELVRRLRADTIPGATPDEAVVYVGGGTATFIDLSDRITLVIDADEVLGAVIEAHRAWIMGEVLATELAVGPARDGAGTVSVDGHPVEVTLTRT